MVDFGDIIALTKYPDFTVIFPYLQFIFDILPRRKLCKEEKLNSSDDQIKKTVGQNPDKNPLKKLKELNESLKKNGM